MEFNKVNDQQLISFAGGDSVLAICQRLVRHVAFVIQSVNVQSCGQEVVWSVAFFVSIIVLALRSYDLQCMIDTCQQCLTSTANQEPHLLANGVFKIEGFVCKPFLPSHPPLSYFNSHPIFCADKTTKIPFFGHSSLPNPTEMLAMQVNFQKYFPRKLSVSDSWN